MLKKTLNIIILLFTACSMQAQNSDYASIDAKALKMPKSQTKSTMQMADWIVNNFPSEAARVRAAYIWVASNISYEVNTAGLQRSYSNEYELVEYALKNRSGVCSHYSYLLCDILNKMGIKSYPVRGYTRNEDVSDCSHQWCLAKVSGMWYFFDPTWGSGYMRGGKFVRYIDDSNYMMLPEEMIKTYMPFDPMFQLLDYPISYAQFDEKSFLRKSKIYYNWSDSLAAYDNQNILQQLLHERWRIANNGKSNDMVKSEMSQINKNIEINSTNNSIDIYNTASDFYNSGIKYLNIFLDYRNKQFYPQHSENDVRAIIYTAASNFNKSFATLKRVNTNNDNLRKSVADLRKSLIKASNALIEQKQFVDKYYRTNPRYRKQLFYVKR